ncbi:MAG: type II toxin-antitoxin system HipA family toxin, partial [Polaromonas sp.]|nr:type II toxin-antitoxin system HipA family toxin [Polaromonas sp.]
LVLQVPATLERVAAELPQSFPQRVFKPIRAGMLAQAEQFISELS